MTNLSAVALGGIGNGGMLGLVNAQVAPTAAISSDVSASNGPAMVSPKTVPSMAEVPSTPDAAEIKANPYQTIDAALNIIITQYLSPSGVVTAQYPTDKAIAQYHIFGMADAQPAA